MSATTIIVEKNVPATMRDGTILRANIYRPAEGGPYPVLLTRQPYNKDFPALLAFLDLLRLAEAGYIVVVQDVRGRFASEGEFRSFPQEFDDGFDTVEWAATLPGADGQVGMWGLSYFGMTQWQAAVGRPAGLKALAPGITFGEYRNGTQYRGGAHELGLVASWPQTAIAADVLMRRHRGDPAQLLPKLWELVGLIDAVPTGFSTLPLLDLPDPSNLVPFMYEWLRLPLHDPFWEEAKIDGRYADVAADTLHIGGWYDCFIGETIRQYTAMREVATARGSRPPRLVVGPWTHGRFDSVVGEIDFGLASAGFFLGGRGDLTALHLQWFDATLKGREAALAQRPAVELFVMGENRWRGYDSWPVPGAQEECWYLASDGHANTRGGDGTLARTAPAGDAPDIYLYDPADPVPTRGGATLLPSTLTRGAVDQGPNEDRPDVLCYTSAPFAEPYTAIGAVGVTLFAASSAPDTDFVARLVDVYPDGRAIGVADGIIRASARDSYPAPSVIAVVPSTPIEPERIYEYSIDLWATAITFLPSHRLRVEITSSSFPRWDRNLNTGKDGVDSSEMAVARQRIFHSPAHPSRLTLWRVE
jgi:uncharacterized protein